MIKDSSLKAIVSDARHIQSNGTLSWKRTILALNILRNNQAIFKAQYFIHS